MRHDMSRVIVEVPRFGSWWKNRKTRLRLGSIINRLNSEQLEDYDSGPNKLPSAIGSKYADRYEEKRQGDRLGPLTRFLYSRVGRPWNDVHSEISRELDNRSLVRGRHVWIHVFQTVSVNCYERDGAIYFRRWQGTNKVDGLYVHPATGLLCYQPRQRHRRDPELDRLLKDERRFGFRRILNIDYGPSGNWRNFRFVDHLTVLEKRNGHWFELKFAYYKPDDVVEQTYNSKLCMYVDLLFRDKPNCPAKRCVAYSQLGKDALKKYHEIINRNPT